MQLRKKVVLGVMMLAVTVSASVLAAASTPPQTPVTISVSSPINVNSADLAALETIKGLGATKAQAIIDYRTKNGHFKTVEEVENVPGVGPKLLQKIQSQITV